MHTVLCRARDITDMFLGLTSFDEIDLGNPWSCQALSKVRLKSATSSSRSTRLLSIIPTRGTVDFMGGTNEPPVTLLSWFPRDMVLRRKLYIAIC